MWRSLLRMMSVDPPKPVQKFPLYVDELKVYTMHNGKQRVRGVKMERYLPATKYRNDPKVLGRPGRRCR